MRTPLHVALALVLLQCGSAGGTQEDDPNEPSVTLGAQNIPCDESSIPDIWVGRMHLRFRAGRAATEFRVVGVRYETFVGDVASTTYTMALAPSGSGILTPGQVLELDALAVPDPTPPGANPYELVIDFEANGRTWTLRSPRTNVVCSG